ncbi:MAG TPA: hypothetical protein DCX14_06380 [Flavobacteriales bacterium]|nr:hypothetical protein [Flavobacteriales bacterium]
MKLSLLPLNFELRSWKDHDFRGFVNARAKLEKIGAGAGKSSDRFKKAREKLETAALQGGASRVIRQMAESIDARALADLLATDKGFVQRVHVTTDLLGRLESLKSPMSRLALAQLIRAYFVHYDEATLEGGLEHWSHFIRRQLKSISTNSGAGDFKAYALNADNLFQTDGPRRVVQQALDLGIDFDNVSRRYGLSGLSDSRYLTLCRYQYYLQTLNELEIGADHPVLAEVCSDDVANAQYSEGKLLGHAILETLIDRTAGGTISKSWQTTVLSIAGDPRVPKTHASYQKWWALLGDERIARMRGWLSRLDLKIFLKILEQSAKDSGNEEMERMFVSRKYFMEGLLNQGLVTDSRLFLSAEASHYVTRNYKSAELPSFARVMSPSTSMIYLNVAGKVHVIEGSHSFRLKLMNRLPKAANIINYGVDQFQDSALRSNILAQYYREFADGERPLEVTHDIHLNWQNKAIRHMRDAGISIEVGKMIARSRIRDYKAKFGSY